MLDKYLFIIAVANIIYWYDGFGNINKEVITNEKNQTHCSVCYTVEFTFSVTDILDID